MNIISITYDKCLLTSCHLPIKLEKLLRYLTLGWKWESKDVTPESILLVFTSVFEVKWHCRRQSRFSFYIMKHTSKSFISSVYSHDAWSWILANAHCWGFASFQKVQRLGGNEHRWACALRRMLWVTALSVRSSWHFQEVGVTVFYYYVIIVVILIMAKVSPQFHPALWSRQLGNSPSCVICTQTWKGNGLVRPVPLSLWE